MRTAALILFVLFGFAAVAVEVYVAAHFVWKFW